MPSMSWKLMGAATSHCSLEGGFSPCQKVGSVIIGIVVQSVFDGSSGGLSVVSGSVKSVSVSELSGSSVAKETNLLLTISCWSMPDSESF